jgi:hypothetical protein
MARPTKPENERKRVDLRIPVTALQKDVIGRAAKSVNLDMAAWARAILIKEAEKQLRTGPRDV